MTTPPYPRNLLQTVKLTDGTMVTVRPIRPEDADIEREFVNSLSAESRYFRFMSSMREISPDLLSRFTRIDYEREMALIATIPTDAGEREIGVARFASLEEPGECEFAIVIADAWQNRGLARCLMKALIDVARERRLIRMHGIVLKSNARMLDFVRSQGFSVETDREDASLAKVSLDL
jgi:acetyltransferase